MTRLITPLLCLALAACGGISAPDLQAVRSIEALVLDRYRGEDAATPPAAVDRGIYCVARGIDVRASGDAGVPDGGIACGAGGGT